MTQQDRVAIRGSNKQPLSGAEPLGAVHPDERLEVTVRVRSQATPALAAHIAALTSRPDGADERLTREAFAERFGADPADLAAVARFAQSHGLSVAASNAARRSVVLAGTVAQMSAAFGVELSLYSHPDDGTYRGRAGEIFVPSELGEIVEGVFGLDNRPVARPHLRRLEELRGSVAAAATPLSTNASFTPPQIASLYDFPTGVTGQGQCVAIIELGGGYRQADLRTYFQQLNIPLPQVIPVSVDHGRNHPTTANSADGEVLLDIEVVGGVAPGAKMVVYFAPNTDQGFLDAISAAVHDTVHRPSVISISWGGPEVTWTQAAAQAMDQAFQAAAVMGISVYCAAGDNGANDFPSGPQQQPGDHVDFPASSPHVVGCGGTHISVANNSITQEVVWNDPGGGATGGGYSTLFARPTWQAAAITGNADNKRGVPDVAADASPASGYQVRVDGGSYVFGGTSAVAPLWAGLTALLNQQRGQPLGFANPVLYQLARGSGALRDITSGNNNGFSAGPGWDPCTGLGVPDGARLQQALGAGTAGAQAAGIGPSGG